MRSRGILKWALLIALSATLLALDQWTKWRVVTTLAVGEAWAPIPALSKLFTITHVQNTGVAFGQLQGAGWLFMVVNVAVLVAVLVYYPRIQPGQWPLRLAAGLILAGDLGNVIDRLRTAYLALQRTGELGAALSGAYVTDFFDFKIWPVFNVADLCLVTGMILLSWMLLQAERQSTARGATSPKAVADDR